MTTLSPQDDINIMSENEKFVVPEQFRADAKWPGDIIIRTTHGQTEENEGELVDFYCHSGTVCLGSPFFDAALSGWKEGRAEGMKHPVDGYKIHGMIEMPDEGAETIRDFLLHLYPGSEFTVSKDNLVKLVEFAHKIDQTSLTKACTDFALQEAKRDPFALLEISGRNGLMEVFQASSSTILMDFDSNRSKEAYIALSPDIRVLFEQAWGEWQKSCVKAVQMSYQRIIDNKDADRAWIPGKNNQDYWTSGLDDITRWLQPSGVEGIVGLGKARDDSLSSSIVSEFENLKMPCVEWDKAKNCPKGFEM